jgi:hypothetical protein
MIETKVRLPKYSRAPLPVQRRCGNMRGHRDRPQSWCDRDFSGGFTGDVETLH